MNGLDMGLLKWFLLCGLAFGCVVFVTEDAEAVERPTDPGPYKMGFINDNFTVTTRIDWKELYSQDFLDTRVNPPGVESTSYVRYFYPAIDDGMNANPDTTGAPYPTIFFVEIDYNLTRQIDLISFLVSHGIIVMFEMGLKPMYLHGVESIDHQLDRINRLNDLTEDPTSILYRMVDTDGMGAIGHNMTGMGATATCCLYPQFKLTIELSPSSPDPSKFYEEMDLYGPMRVEDKNAMVIVGDLDPTSMNTASIAYNAFTKYSEDGGAIIKATVANSGIDGPWPLDLIVSFILYHLKEIDDYETFLYGEKVLDGIADDRYKIEFQRTGDTQFPPDMMIEVPSAPIYMETNLELNITFIEYPEFYTCSELTVDWYVDNNGSKVPFKQWSVVHQFQSPKKYKLSARWKIGEQYGWVAPIEFTVVNMPPVANAGLNITVNMDEEVVFDGNASWDTPSHVAGLEYKWSFPDGDGTEYSNVSMFTKTFTEARQFQATLTVRDPLGAESTSVCYITVENVAPNCNISRPKDDAKRFTDSKIEFIGLGRDTPSDNNSLWYSWDFGDGRTADSAKVSHTYEEAGTYTVTLTVEDDDGAISVVTHNITIKAAPLLDGPVVFSLAVGFFTILGLAVAFSTEPGKYWLGLVGAPLFVKTQEVLDNKTRHALLGIIVKDPGIHYSAIKEEFGLANGAAAHHLYVLERESFIRSVRDGKLKRFYQTDVKVPDDVGMSPEETRGAIVELVRERPGISQLEIMEELELERNEASYYLRNLVKEDRLKAGKEGRFTVYMVNGRK